MTEEDYRLRRLGQRTHEMVVRRSHVEVEPFLRGLPGAPSIATIIESKDVHPQPPQVAQHPDPLGDAAGVAVTVENDPASLGMGNPPTVQLHLVRRMQPYIFGRQTIRGGIPDPVRVAVRQEYFRPLETIPEETENSHTPHRRRQRGESDAPEST